MEVERNVRNSKEKAETLRNDEKIFKVNSFWFN